MVAHKNIIDLLYAPCQFHYSGFQPEPEGAQYSAGTFTLNNLSVVFRVAKITPKKTGQFVTLWQRGINGAIRPYNMNDNIDLLVVSTCDGNNGGQFIFSKSALLKHKIICDNKNNAGKLAMRVYPPWSISLNTQATKTQNWQLEYFLALPENQEIDYVRAKRLYNLK